MRKYLFLFIFSVLLFNFIVAKEYKRIVSISPVVTEIVYLLEAQDRLVGVTSACDYPKEALELPEVGDFTQPNLERIVALEPDLVVGMGNENSVYNQKLLKMGIETKVLGSPKSFAEIYNIIDLLGSISGQEDKAATVVADLKAQVVQIKDESLKMKVRPTVLVLIWERPMIAAGQDTFINEMIEAAGGQNMIRIKKIQYPHISAELVLHQKPDIIIRGYDKEESSIDPDLLMRSGPRFVEGVRGMQKLFL
ncbi:ABC transporter substrate-binding protein [bacterium]|nr:ABC transporter substrate-binding protein [bacterium]MBT4552885.1 ABC transporter substrate-binding protein [bacterium]